MSKEKGKTRRGITIMYIILALVIVFILLTVILNNVVFTRVEVVGSSMVGTLNDGDVVVASKKAKPKRGDIVVIKNLEENKHVIKRMVAVAGDTIMFKSGNFYVKKKNTTEFVETLGVPLTSNAYFNEGVEYVIENGTCFYLGDNYAISKDSRENGCCLVKDITAVVPKWAVKMKKFSTFMVKKIRQPISKFFKSCGVYYRVVTN